MPGAAAALPSALVSALPRLLRHPWSSALSEAGRGVSSASTVERQTGHVLCVRSHLVRQAAWCMCPHGICVASSSTSHRQMEHCVESVGGQHFGRAVIARSLAGGGPTSPGRSAPLMRSEKMLLATAPDRRCTASEEEELSEAAAGAGTPAAPRAAARNWEMLAGMAGTGAPAKPVEPCIAAE